MRALCFDTAPRQAHREKVQATIAALHAILDELCVLFFLVNRPPKLSGKYGTSMWEAYLERCLGKFDGITDAIVRETQVACEHLQKDFWERSLVRFVRRATIESGQERPQDDPEGSVRDAYESLVRSLVEIREDYFHQLAARRSAGSGAGGILQTEDEGAADETIELADRGECPEIDGAALLLSFNIDDAMRGFAFLQGLDNCLRLLIAFFETTG